MVGAPGGAGGRQWKKDAWFIIATLFTVKSAALRHFIDMALPIPPSDAI
jgi:hypothetical protein